jgi:hypothetical protein
LILLNAAFIVMIGRVPTSLWATARRVRGSARRPITCYDGQYPRTGVPVTVPVAVVRHDGPVITGLFAVAVQSAPGAMDALNPAAPHAFGVDRAGAVIALIFALSLAAMILGGHLRASLKRSRAGKDH